MFPWREQGVIVTGTDTEVGKTWVSGSLAYWMKRGGRDVNVWKPVQSGVAGVLPELTDAGILRLLSGSERELEEICPISLEHPLAPWMAARRAGIVLEPEHFIAEVRKRLHETSFLIIEGAGGLLAPLAERFDLLQLAIKVQLPLLIVARPGLGTVNHTLLTVQVARMHGVKVTGVVLNGATDPNDQMIVENIEMIEQLGDVRVLAVTPHVSEPLKFRERFGAVWGRTYPWIETEDGQ